jgi:SPP1 gp7 family putative phage head morphogenesis protein
VTTPQQPPPSYAQQDAEVAAIAAALVTAISAVAALQMIRLELRRSNRLAYERRSALYWRALGGALEVAFQMPPEAAGVTGPATIYTARLNQLRRAQMIYAMGDRLLGDLTEARSRGQSIRQALAAGVSRERRYFGMHVGAMWNRARAAQQADLASWSYGDLLGWWSVRDKKTSPECRAAHGKNFLVTDMPYIGFPGAVHPHCRCIAVPPWPGGRMLTTAYSRRYVLVPALRGRI